MRINDVQLGDWVQKVDTPIRWDKDNLLEALSQGQCVPLQNIHPIGITAEIMHRNSFDNDGNKFFLLPLDDTYNVIYDLTAWSVSIVWSGDGYKSKSDTINNIQYVHQLQQVLRLWGLKGTAEDFAL